MRSLERIQAAIALLVFATAFSGCASGRVKSGHGREVANTHSEQSSKLVCTGLKDGYSAEIQMKYLESNFTKELEAFHGACPDPRHLDGQDGCYGPFMGLKVFDQNQKLVYELERTDIRHVDLNPEFSMGAPPSYIYEVAKNNSAFSSDSPRYRSFPKNVLYLVWEPSHENKWSEVRLILHSHPMIRRNLVFSIAESCTVK